MVTSAPLEIVPCLTDLISSPIVLIKDFIFGSCCSVTGRGGGRPEGTVDTGGVGGVDRTGKDGAVCCHVGAAGGGKTGGNGGTGRGESASFAMGRFGGGVFVATNLASRF